MRRCKQTGRDYLLCDYNRDGDSYRSPWSNQFDPPLDEGGSLGGVGSSGGNEGAGEGAVPGERVRKMEVKANEAFDVYRELYYEGGVSSVYFWNLDDGFAGVVLLKKGASPPLSKPDPTNRSPPQHPPKAAATAKASGTRSTSLRRASAGARATTDSRRLSSSTWRPRAPRWASWT